MKFHELQPGDTFEIANDPRVFLKTDALKLNSVIIHHPTYVRIGERIQVDDTHEVEFRGSIVNYKYVK